MQTQLDKELQGINRRLNRWRALEQALWWMTALLGTLAVSAAIDAFFRPGRTGRLLLFGVIGALALAGVGMLGIMLKRKRSAAAVAAILEHHFPQLDNHLINRVLFSRTPAESSVWQRHYLRDPIPGWRQLPLAGLKNRRTRRWGVLSLVAALLLLAVPGAILGPAWGLALARVLNPLAELTPPTLATLVGVEPGDGTVVQGEDVVLSCEASGRSGQSVDLHLWPHDDRPSVVRLGILTGEGVERFSHRLAKLAGPLQYRFAVGDAPPSERFQIQVLDPLALKTLDLRIIPPAYTGLSTVTLDGVSETIAIPQDAEVEVRLVANREAAQARIGIEPEPLRTLKPQTDSRSWQGGLAVVSGSVMRVEIEDARGDILETDLRFTLVEDQPPVLQVTYPSEERAPLAPGALPLIGFEASDDYALEWVRLERVNPEDAPDAAGSPVRTWQAHDRQQTLVGEWRGTLDDLATGTAFRLVARDYRGGRPGRETRSAIIQFVPASRTQSLEAGRDRNRASRATLVQIIDWQHENMGSTRSLKALLPGFVRADWASVRALQTQIRQATGTLLQSTGAVPEPVRPVLQRVWQLPMADVLAVLDRLDRAPAAQREDLARQSLALQQTILTMLQRGDSRLAHQEKAQSASGILALVEALIKAQLELIDVTEAAQRAESTPGAFYIERQDTLAVEIGELTTLCRTEALRLAEGDADYADMLQTLAALSERLRIQPHMLMAAEHMERTRLDAALEAQDQALRGLVALQERLNAWRADHAETERENALDNVQDVKSRLEKIADIQSRILEAIDATRSQGDKTDGIPDDLRQELQEIKPSMADALLSIATDLHMLMELPLSNALVEDLFEVFEAVEQEPGSDDAETWEEARLKEDAIMEALEEAMERVDDMEMWLADAPDPVARQAEGIDQEEMPQDMPLTPLPESLRDLIGDLLEQQEQMREETQDSASNQAVPDAPFRAEVAEGDLTSFLAKGQSGNMPPEHVEQDGRSQIGREGMSDGESIAASGTVKEGDDEIDRRMTRDPAQGGVIESEEHTDAKATGGGKLSGFSDDFGMAGTGPRRDAPTEEGSELGRQAQLRRQAESLYAQATLNHIRTGNLDEAIRHMRQAEAALAEGRAITEVHAFQRRAVGALRLTRSRLDAGIDDEAIGLGGGNPLVEEGIASTPDDAPREYRDMVSAYFKALSEVLREP